MSWCHDEADSEATSPQISGLALAILPCAKGIRRGTSLIFSMPKTLKKFVFSKKTSSIFLMAFFLEKRTFFHRGRFWEVLLFYFRKNRTFFTGDVLNFLFSKRKNVIKKNWWLFFLEKRKCFGGIRIRIRIWVQNFRTRTHESFPKKLKGFESFESESEDSLLH